MTLVTVTWATGARLTAIEGKRLLTLLNYLMWHRRGSNPQSTAPDVDALPLHHFEQDIKMKLAILSNFSHCPQCFQRTSLQMCHIESELEFDLHYIITEWVGKYWSQRLFCKTVHVHFALNCFQRLHLIVFRMVSKCLLNHFNMRRKCGLQTAFVEKVGKGETSLNE